MPPRTDRQPGQAHVADRNARQARDGVADGGEHPAHLPLAALKDGQFDFGLRLLFGVRFVTGLDHPPDVDVFGGRGGAVVEHQALRQPRQGGLVRDAAHDGAVRLGDVVLRVGQMVQKVAVVGQKDQAVRVGVQPPDRA